MESDYFLKYPACPDCGSPIYDRSPVKIDTKNGRYICGEVDDYHIYNKVLPWKINLNPVQNAYIEWMCSGIRGIHVINWPFSNRELFISVASDTAANSLKQNVLLIGNRNIVTEKTVENPGVHEIFQYLYHVKNQEKYSTAGISRNDIFPLIAGVVEYRINGTISGKILRSSLWKDIAEYHCVTREELNLRKFPKGARLGNLNLYNSMDYREFFSDIPIKAGNNVTVVEYRTPENLMNYIKERNPVLIIVDAGSDTDILEFFKNYNAVPAVVFSDYNMRDVNTIIGNSGIINFHPLKSAEFMTEYSSMHESSNQNHTRRFHTEYITYSTPTTSISAELALDGKITERFRHIERLCILTLRNISEINVNNDNISSILDDIYGISTTTGDLFKREIEDKFGPDFDRNPWRDEFMNIIKNRKINDRWTIIAGKFLDKYLSVAGINDVQISRPGDTEGRIYDGVIMPGILGNFNFNTLNTDKVVFCGTDDSLGYARYYMENSKYMEFYNPFIRYDGDMPETVRTIMSRINYDAFETYRKYSDDNSVYGIDYSAHMHGRSGIVQKTVKSGEDAVYLYGTDGRYVIFPAGIEVYVIRGSRVESIRLSASNKDKLTGTYILFDRQGLYRSIHAELLNFILNSGDLNTVRVGDKNISTMEIFTVSRMWINGLSRLSESIDPGSIATDLKNLGLSAENESYIRRWWIPIENWNDSLKLYIADSPKTRQDMIKIFKYVRNKLKDSSFTGDMAVECYNDVIALHRIINNILHGRYSDLGKKFFNIIIGSAGDERLLIEKVEIKKVSNSTDAYTINYLHNTGSEVL